MRNTAATVATVNATVATRLIFWIRKLPVGDVMTVSRWPRQCFAS